MNAEQTLIGFILKSPLHAFKSIPNTLAGHQFSDVWLGEVFDRLRRDGLSPDFDVQAFVLGYADETERRFLMTSFSTGSAAINGQGFAELITEDYRKRSIRGLCNHFSDLTIPSMETIAALQKELGDLAKTEQRNRITDSEAKDLILLDMQNRSPAQSTGYSKLDAAMDGGLFPGKAYGFVARKKVGKTILACSLSYNLAQAGVNHAFICGEMGAKEVHERALSRHLQVYSSDFRSDKRKDSRFQSRVRSTEHQGHAIYYDCPNLTFDQLRTTLGTAVIRDGIKGFILDYWQLVRGKEGSSSTSEHLDEVAQWMAGFCKQHNIWAVVMGQVNQEGNTRGGEGLRLAFDQVYHLQRMEDDISSLYVWLEMMDTRYTGFKNLGSKTSWAFAQCNYGPYFTEDLDEAQQSWR